MNQPAFQGIDVVYKGKADNKDIRDLLEKLVPKATEQMKEYAQKFKGANELETSKKIFNFLKNDIGYIADGEEQIIKLPSALLKKKVADCKSYSLFTAAVLENLGIPYVITYTSYNDNPIPHHVYIVTKNGIIIDAVYGIFNKEKKANYKYKKNMNVRYMAGINGSCGCQNRQLGNVGIGVNVNTPLLAPGRAVFSLLIKSNIDGIASRLQNGNITNSTQFADKWKQLGGDRTVLAKQIKEGASKKAKNLGFFKLLKKILAKRGVNGIGETQIPNEVKLLIRAACQKLGSSVPAVGAAGGAALSETIIGLLPVLISAIKTTPDSTGDEINWGGIDETGAGTPPPIVTYPTTNPTNNNSKPSSVIPSNDTLLYVGGGLLVAGAIYFATKK
jgi:hypothetical protein